MFLIDFFYNFTSEYLNIFFNVKFIEYYNE